MWFWIGTASAALLRIVVIWRDEGIYPGLPADLIIPVDYFVFALGFPAVLLLAVAAIARHAGNGVLSRRTVALSAWLGAPALVLAPDIVGRQFGRWGDLRHELVQYQQDIEKYVREHGRVGTEAQAAALVTVLPSRQFTFSRNGPEVWIVYRWWWGDEAQTLIIWGRGRSAAFDFGTMICDYVD